MIVLDELPAPKPAKTTHGTFIRALHIPNNTWQRISEITFTIALGLIIGAAVTPWH